MTDKTRCSLDSTNLNRKLLVISELRLKTGVDSIREPRTVKRRVNGSGAALGYMVVFLSNHRPGDNLISFIPDLVSSHACTRVDCDRVVWAESHESNVHLFGDGEQWADRIDGQ